MTPEPIAVCFKPSRLCRDWSDYGIWRRGSKEQSDDLQPQTRVSALRGRAQDTLIKGVHWLTARDIDEDRRSMTLRRTECAARRRCCALTRRRYSEKDRPSGSGCSP